MAPEDTGSTLARSLARSPFRSIDRSIDPRRERPRARSGCCWQRRRIPQRDPRRVSRTPAALLSRVRADDAMGSSYALAPAPDRPADQRRPTRTNDDNGIAGGALSPARHDTQGPVPRPPPLSSPPSRPNSERFVKPKIQIRRSRTH